MENINFDEFEKSFEKDGYKCSTCGKHFDGKPYNILYKGATTYYDKDGSEVVLDEGCDNMWCSPECTIPYLIDSHIAIGMVNLSQLRSHIINEHCVKQEDFDRIFEVIRPKYDKRERKRRFNESMVKKRSDINRAKKKQAKKARKRNKKKK